MPYEDSSAEVRQRVLCSTDGVTACDVLARGLRRGVIDVEPQAFDRLILPVRGLFMQHESDARQRVATPNHALLVTANAPFRVSYVPNASDQCLVLCWSASARDDAVGEALRSGKVATNVLVSPALMLERSLLWRRLWAGDADPLEMEERCMRLLDAVLTTRCGAPSEGSRAVRRRIQVERVKEAITLEPARRWTLHELAALAAASPYHLAHVFRSEVGTSVYDYVLRTRLSHALERVLDGDSDLTRIALDTGFATHSHFTSRFRTTFGLPPSALRHRSAAAS